MNFWFATFVSCILLVLLVTANYFYPYGVGIFSIERYPYSSQYKVMFIFLLVMMNVFFFVGLKDLVSPLKIVVVGFLVGYFCSFLSYFICNLFFYNGRLEVVGLKVVAGIFKDNPHGGLIGFLLMPVALMGWLYGGVLACLTRYVERLWLARHGPDLD